MESFELFWEATCGKRACNVTANGIHRGDRVVNINPQCDHYKSRGKVKKIRKIKGCRGTVAGNVVEYTCTNNGKRFKRGDTLQKTEIQLKKRKKK